MKRLSDFKPIELLELPGLGALDCRGLIVIVGPNSSGKTQLLRDIYMRLAGQPRALVVAKGLRIGKPVSFDDFVACVEAEGVVSKVVEGNGRTMLKPLAPFIGAGESVNAMDLESLRSWHQGYVPDIDRPTPSEFLSVAGRLFVTGLFLERRLTALYQVGPIDYENQAPSNDLHGLHLSDTAAPELYQEMLAAFGVAVFPDASKGNQLVVRVSDDGASLAADDRLIPRKMMRLRTIESEGDGLKSYATICTALLLGTRPVCLVDEPELCLHPPQANRLGRFIGGVAASRDTATFVATHSSHVLRGVLQAKVPVQIVRLTRRRGTFDAHLVSSRVLADAVAKPTMRTESLLDGIFSEAVAIVEADGDRLVYQAVWGTLPVERRPETHFTAVGGTGGIADTCKLYRTLRIPIAVIADLDLLSDAPRLRSVVTALGNGTDPTTLLKGAEALVRDVLELLPPTSWAEAKKVLVDLSASDLDWAKKDDETLLARLKPVIEGLNRRGRLKKGLASLPVELQKRAEALLSEFKSIGLFLVPVGELEGWLTGQRLPPSTRNKQAWAEAAANRVLEVGLREGDVWGFLEGVGKYLLASLDPIP